jgi:pSer/pThr/pTyr-binding forkhead associated (FHA) protein/pimeloyl-ACP methyl ester carboxylesterase
MLGIQLVVSVSPGQVRTYHVTKAELTIGRFPANDVVLYDPKASRQHARLRLVPNGFEIEDLNSLNGTLLNGQPIQHARLRVGDAITIGDSTLRLQETTDRSVAVSSPQTIAELTKALAEQVMEVELADVALPRLVVHTPARTWEVTLTEESLTVGRDTSCQIVIEDNSVSRQHARIVREGRGFVLMDLDSRNGTWHQGQRIQKHVLRPGDMFQIGNAAFIYKGPIDQEALTQMIDHPLTPPRGVRRPVVFIPGFMGSELWRGNEQIWPNVTAMFTNPELYRWPSREPIEARRLVSEMVIVPNFIKLERHNELGDFLCEGLGYQRGKDLLEFPWDWRLDLRVVARQLGERITRWREEVKEAQGLITLIAHSLGCLVARYYVEQLGGKSVVNRMILIGGPHNGTPKTLQAFAALGKQPLVYTIAEPFQRAITSLPSVYTMLPSYPAVFNSASQEIDLYRDESWALEECRSLLRNALAFHQELGAQTSVSTICVFGYGVRTPTRAILEDRKQGGGWERILFSAENKGDNTVPEESGRLPGTEMHPIQQHHGALCADNDVKMRLKLELTR